jgi:hypothetical protein
MPFKFFGQEVDCLATGVGACLLACDDDGVDAEFADVNLFETATSVCLSSCGWSIPGGKLHIVKMKHGK